ncbi:RNA polymerase subunit sigma-70 [Nocardioides anomalus]|uniref:RNA polymerase subunit sigma-70 n=1 Tax=Nocardioides anomalus TaxID=2712223 RepID=A0A6G6WKI3_9ACTN|nr:sigma factor [Nocardioides anomalus]QIG45744.1 RNA polymerase subunit sigma-70 [Nocardioides anomalus]
MTAAPPAAPSSRVSDLEGAATVFLAERTRLLRIAQRVVGDRAAAEDVVQDAWLRWQRTDHAQIQNPAAFLTTATTHLAINVVQSARYRHEAPTEELRIAVVAETDPAARAERSAENAALLGHLMSRLSPSELAAYLLRKAFEYPYEELAAVLGTNAPHARQLVRRAHVALIANARHRVDRAAHQDLVAAFAGAASGDLGPLEDLLKSRTGRAARCTRRRMPRGVASAA